MSKVPVNLQRTYELTYVLSGAMSETEVAQVKSEVDALFKKYKATDVQVIDWGKRPLAYVITHESKKQHDGNYTHCVFQLDPARAQEFERDVFLMPKFMRHLFLLQKEKEEELARMAAKLETAEA